MKTSQSNNRNLRPLIQLPKITSGRAFSALGVVLIWFIYTVVSSTTRKTILRSETDVELIVHQPHTIEIIMHAAKNDKISIPEKRYLIDERRLHNVSYDSGCSGKTLLAIEYRPPNAFTNTIYIYNLTFEEWTQVFNQLEGPKREQDE